MNVIALVLILLVSPLLRAEMNIDPFADGHLTCAEMRAAPNEVFIEDIDLGSGHASPVWVDYHCRDGAGSLPFLQNLLALAEAIRSETPSQCTGSIVHAHQRYYNFALLMAGISPKHFIESRKDLTRTPVHEAYFNAWAAESPSNHRLWQAFTEALSDAQPLLAAHYQAGFGMPREEAELVSSEVLTLITTRAAGSFPGSSRMPPTSPKMFYPLSAAIISASLDMRQIRSILEGDPLQAELDQALKVALAGQLPLEIIAELIARLDTLDTGDESALFFSLNYPAAMDLLLSEGASVDYANSFGKTALFYAIEHGESHTVSRLLAHGADANRAYKNAEALESSRCYTHNITHSSRTPLMHAAQHSDTKMLALLLDSGARLNAVDGLNWNALDYALKHQRQANADFLRSMGATPATSQGS